MRQPLQEACYTDDIEAGLARQQDIAVWIYSGSDATANGAGATADVEDGVPWL
jgi:hypothetical protein